MMKLYSQIYKLSRNVLEAMSIRSINMNIDAPKWLIIKFRPEKGYQIFMIFYTLSEHPHWFSLSICLELAKQMNIKFSIEGTLFICFNKIKSIIYLHRCPWRIRRIKAQLISSKRRIKRFFN